MILAAGINNFLLKKSENNLCDGQCCKCASYTQTHFAAIVHPHILDVRSTHTRRIIHKYIYIYHIAQDERGFSVAHTHTITAQFTRTSHLAAPFSPISNSTPCRIYSHHRSTAHTLAYECAAYTFCCVYYLFLYLLYIYVICIYLYVYIMWSRSSSQSALANLPTAYAASASQRVSRHFCTTEKPKCIKRRACMELNAERNINRGKLKEKKYPNKAEEEIKLTHFL